MKTVDALIAARKLIENPANWFQGSLFEYDSDGKVCAMCAVGATCAVAGWAAGKGTWDFDLEKRCDHYLLAALRDMKRLGWSGPEERFRSVPQFNDHADTKHSEVLALYDRAIARAKRRHLTG